MKRPGLRDTNSADDLLQGYKRTEFGDLPQDWVIDTLGSLFEFQNGVNADKAAYGSGVPFINVLEVIKFPRLMAEDVLGRVTLDPNVAKAFRVKTGDVLFNRTSETQTEVGLASVYLGTEEVVFGGFVIRGRPTDRELNPLIVSLILRTPSVRSQIIASGQGVVRANIGQRELGRVRLPIPPRAEQNAIAEALSDADALIESLSLLLAKKRQIKQGAMQELLTGKKRLPGFHRQWSLLRLDAVGTFIKGCGIKRDEASSGTLPCVRYGEIYTSHSDYIREFSSWISPEVAAKATRIRRGDLLFAGSGETKEEIGKSVALLGDIAAFAGGDIVILRPTMEASPVFMGYALNTLDVVRQKSSLGQGDAVVHISATALGRVTVDLPEVQEQEAIAQVLFDLDANIDLVEARLEKARDIKQAMMQELLTGRIRLVQPGSNVIPLQAKPVAVNHPPTQRAHNWQINEAVVIGVLAQRFGNEKFPLPRKRRVKLMYLLHRHAEGRAEGYLKKAAGPYDPNTKYKGPEAIALKNGYVRAVHNGTYEGFVAGDKSDQAQRYFEQWCGSEALDWLERFHFRRTDELELLATVDMAMVDLAAAGQPADLAGVKRVIAANQEWVPKPSRELFSDEGIQRAIVECAALFPA